MTEQKPEPLSLQGYRGTRDFFPEDQRIRCFLRDHLRRVLTSFGYDEYDGPFLEPLELYASKSSQEIVQNQLYSFQDRGERLLAIRPEMTPTLARMIAAKQKELLRPIRWFSIPTCMRFERPQRGRLREFDQLNVDLFGGQPLDEDLEILLTGIHILRSFGAPPETFEVKVSHRGLTNALLENLVRAPAGATPQLLRLLDKKEKMPQEQFVYECSQLGLQPENTRALQDMLSFSLEEIIVLLEEHAKPALELKERIDAVNRLTQSACVKFSPAITRGFDYYTGMVFEFFDTHPDNRRSLFGGGRYDNLVAAFGGEPLSGIGYGMGDVTLLNFLDTHQLLPKLKKRVDICVLRFSEDDRLQALTLALALRGHGLNVEAPLTLSKFGKQIQHAEKAGALAIVFYGAEDLQNNTFSAKWLVTGEQEHFANEESGYLKFIEKKIFLSKNQGDF